MNNWIEIELEIEIIIKKRDLLLFEIKHGAGQVGRRPNQ